MLLEFLSRRGVLALAAAALTFACAGARAQTPDAAVRQALAPSGKLRVGVYLGSPTSLLRDANGEKGVTYDLGHELAARLGVPFELVEYPRVAVVIGALKAGQVDFTVTNGTPARAKDVDFTPPILAIELGYLVPQASKVAAPADIDRPGIKLGVTQGSSSQGKLSAELKSATLVTAPTVPAAIEMLKTGGIDVFASNKAILSEMSDAVPGSRILGGRWGLEHMAIGVPQGRAAGQAYLVSFAADVKAKGLVQRAAQRAGLRGLAPTEE